MVTRARVFQLPYTDLTKATSWRVQLVRAAGLVTRKCIRMLFVLFSLRALGDW
jgi:hypothetical protein